MRNLLIYEKHDLTWCNPNENTFADWWPIG